MTIADELSLLANTKSEIKSAIIQKGVEVLDTDPFSVYPDKILQIPSGGYAELTVSGENSITLQNAKADGLEYLKLFGGTEQRNLPSGYTQVNYVTNTASTVVNTGIMLDFNNNYEFEIECRAVLGSWYLFQSRGISGGPSTGITGSSTGNTIVLNIGGTSVCTSAITRTEGNILYIKATFNNGTATLYVKNKTSGVENTQTNSYTITSNPTSPMCLFGNLANQFILTGSNIYMARIKENGIVIMDYVPCKQNTTAGFYDKVSDTFKTTTDLSAGADVTVPTPDAPIDIWCNNGVVKARHASGLPFGYTLLNGITGDGNAHINLNCTLDQDDEIEIELTMPSVGILSRNIFGYRDAASSNNISALIAATSANICLIDFNNSNYATYRLLTSNALSVSTRYRIVINKTGRYIYQGSILVASDTTACPDTILTGNALLFNTGGSPSAINKFNGIIHRCTIKGKRNVVPCKNANSEVGMYDLVSGQFFANAGTGAFVAGSTVSDPVEIYVDGTQEVVTDSLGDTASAERLLAIDTYKDTQEVLNGNVTRQIGIVILDGTETWIDDRPNPRFYTVLIPPSIEETVTRSIPAYCSHFKMLSNGEPFASITIGQGYLLRSGQTDTRLYFHLSLPTLADFKQWLADQYAQGTPVIVVYPLATATTETVTPQPMNIQTGTNVIEITQASLDNLELEAKYLAGAVVSSSLTQSRNLDNSVEVTVGE